MNDITLALLGDHSAAKRVTESGKLLPCPRCGGKGLVERHPEFGWAQYEVRCTKCTLAINAFYQKKDAAKYWNTRAPILTPEQIKRLDAARDKKKAESDV